jgi:protein CpxP
MKMLKNMITGSILTTLLLTLMGTALAQGQVADTADSAKKGRNHQRGNQSMPAVEQMMRGIRHLDLSDEQKASIKGIMKGLKAEERPLAKETKAGHEQLKELIKAESFDELAVTALAEQEGALAAERLIIASRAMSAVYGQLTDEQRMELESMATKRAERRAGKHGQRSVEGRSTEG